MFKQGGFVVSIGERPWHSVGIDESHEMLINKDCKTSVVRPLPDYINRIACHTDPKHLKTSNEKFYLHSKTQAILLSHRFLHYQMTENVSRISVLKLRLYIVVAC